MTDPKRWLVDEDAPDAARQLLRAMQAPTAPSAVKQGELARKLASSAAVPSLAPVSVVGSSWLKVGLVYGGSASGVALLLAALQGLSGQPETTVTQPLPKPEVLASAPNLAPLAPGGASETSPPLVTPSEKTERHLASNPPARSAPRAARDALAEEEALLERARSYSSSAPHIAWELLERHRRRFSTGQLVAERMSLSVDVLTRLKQARAAQAQAEALMRQFPDSVYSVQLRQRRHAPP